MRILLAEDEQTLAKAIVKIFEKNKYAADAVYNGEDALAYIGSGNYDVAVLDIMMPKMDGLTVLKKTRAAGNRIPVLLLTAKSEIEDRVLGLDSGANFSPAYAPSRAAKPKPTTNSGSAISRSTKQLSSYPRRAEISALRTKNINCSNILCPIRSGFYRPNRLWKKCGATTATRKSTWFGFTFPICAKN